MAIKAPEWLCWSGCDCNLGVQWKESAWGECISAVLIPVTLLSAVMNRKVAVLLALPCVSHSLSMRGTDKWMNVRFVCQLLFSRVPCSMEDKQNTKLKKAATRPMTGVLLLVTFLVFGHFFLFYFNVKYLCHVLPFYCIFPQCNIITCPLQPQSFLVCYYILVCRIKLYTSWEENIECCWSNVIVFYFGKVQWVSSHYSLVYSQCLCSNFVWTILSAQNTAPLWHFVITNLNSAGWDWHWNSGWQQSLLVR